METITITEEQKENLCSSLAGLVFDLKKDESIECIYFAPYTHLRHIIGNILKITIVVKDGMGGTNEDEYGEESSLGYEEIKYGVKLYFSVDNSKFYSTFPLNDTERMKGNDLFNSTILYDRTGEYTEIKEKVDRIGTKGSSLYYYSNLAKIEPPIIDEVNHIIELEEQTKAVKESIKTKLFEQFKQI